MQTPNRREVLGTLAAAGGWIALNAEEAMAQTSPPSASAGSSPKTYELPPLPYAYDALEPHIDAQTMTLHHDKHHAAYVNGLNAAIAALAKVRESDIADDLAKIRDLSDSVAFNGSGHALHAVFWTNMKKGGGGEPSGTLAQMLSRDFGSFAKFRTHFTNASAKVQGSGWGILAWEPLAGRLLVLAAEKHQNLTVFGCVPLLVLDVWEHAYYLKYQNNRAGYIEAFWSVVNWDNVAERLNQAARSSV